MGLGTFITGLFSAPKIADKAVSAIIDAGDAIVYTKEEKVQDIIGMVKSLQDQFTPRAVTRRILAVFILGNFYLHLNLSIGFYCFGMAGAVEFMNSILSMEWKVALAVVVFYFGYYGWMNVKGK